ncbi:MAG: OsmC family protein [Halobacteriales archaeon]
MADDTSGNVTNYRLTATRLSPKRTRVDTGEAEFVVGKDVNPVEYFLGSVLACLNSTGTMVARDMDLDIEALEMRVEGDVDYSRYKGEPSTARPGLQSLAVSLSVTADADEATLETWLERVEDRCPVTDNVEHETDLEVELD